MSRYRFSTHALPWQASAHSFCEAAGNSAFAEARRGTACSGEGWGCNGCSRWALKEQPHAAATRIRSLRIRTADILNLLHAELSTLLNYELDPVQAAELQSILKCRDHSIIQRLASSARPADVSRGSEAFAVVPKRSS